MRFEYTLHSQDGSGCSETKQEAESFLRGEGEGETKPKNCHLW